MKNALRMLELKQSPQSFIPTVKTCGFKKLYIYILSFLKDNRRYNSSLVNITFIVSMQTQYDSVFKDKTTNKPGDFLR